MTGSDLASRWTMPDGTVSTGELALAAHLVQLALRLRQGAEDCRGETCGLEVHRQHPAHAIRHVFLGGNGNCLHLAAGQLAERREHIVELAGLPLPVPGSCIN